MYRLFVRKGYGLIKAYILRPKARSTKFGRRPIFRAIPELVNVMQPVAYLKEMHCHRMQSNVVRRGLFIKYVTHFDTFYPS